jgi:hypothetical protein
MTSRREEKEKTGKKETFSSKLAEKNDGKRR